MGKINLDFDSVNTAGALAGIGTPDDVQYLSPTQDGIAPNGKEYLTLDEAVANLTRTGGHWNVGGNGVITYSFLEQSPNGLYNNPHETYLAGLTQEFLPFTAEQRDAAREAIALWDDLIAPKFVEKDGHGGGADINFMNTGEGGPGQAAAFIPDNYGKYNKINGDLYVDALQPDNFDLYPGGYGQTTMVHEIGHTIGLSHTGDYDASDGEAPTYAKSATFFQDSYQFSIMSYFGANNTGAAGYVNWATGGYYQTPQTPMIHDIAAVQAVYGADLTTRTGNTTYGFNSTADRDVYDFTINTNPFLSIYDAGGNDTLDLSGFTGAKAVLDLRPGAFSTGYNHGNAAELNAVWGINGSQAFWDAVYDGLTANPAFLTQNIGIAYNTIIENGRTGAGGDTLIGNDVANRLDGGRGNDVFTGNGGNDIFVFNDVGGADRITDFTRGSDKIDLGGMDAIAGTGKNDAFTFLGDGAFTKHAGELHTQLSGSSWFLSGDVNGDGLADFSINLGTAHVTLSDIYL